MRKLMLVGRLF